MPDLARTLWEDYWHLICHRSELPSHGDFQRVEILDFEVVVFNDGGELIAFDNICPHRGARIFSGHTGNQAATCPYHGWTFVRGKVIVPDPLQFGHCDLSRARLRQWPMEWVGDFLFVGLHPVLGIREQLGDAAERLEDISFGISGRGDWNAGTFECTWQVAVENVLEPDHVAQVHPQSLGRLELEKGEDVFYGLNSAWYAKVGNSRVARQLKTLKRFFNLDYQFEGFSSLYLFPFTMLTSTYGYTYSLQSFFPNSQQGRTNMVSRLLKMCLRPGLDPAEMANFFESAAQMSRRVLEEDHDICRRVPMASWSMEAPYFYAQTESKLLHFRQSCRDVLFRHLSASQDACAAKNMSCKST